ncbi:MAG: hypothetical protein WAN03_05480 [Candidatus Sulfotelmatobacter sp.]
MGRAVYNSAIPAPILISVNRALRSKSLPIASLFFLVLSLLAAPARAVDWSVPEQELARKIVSVTGPGVIALTIENRSSLGTRENEIIQNGLHVALGNLGIRFAKSEQAAATVTIALSENVTSYVWVAEIHQSAGEAAVVIVSTSRPESSVSLRDSVPLTLHKTLLYSQSEPILDVSIIEESTSPAHIAVLDSEKVSLYRVQGAKWQLEQSMSISHSRPWPRDLRGKLVLDRDHLLQVFLPGVICSSTAALTLNCHENDDPWPLVPPSFNTPNIFPRPNSISSPGVPFMKAFFAPARDFFTGTVTPPVGKFSSIPRFYSAAAIPREKYVLWLFAATDGQVHMIDGVSDQVARLGWGSDLTGVRTPCGAGWQVLATTSADNRDSIRAYEFPDRDPVAVSGAVDFSGPVTALWTETKGDGAIAVAKNQETGNYEAYRLELACSQ